MGPCCFFRIKSLRKQIGKKRIERFEGRRKKSKGRVISDISGSSLTDSDLIFHNEIKVKNAKETLALGRSVHIQIEGNIDEAIRDLAQLESN
ncbi:hypothetical protein V6N11_084378 [Hibiscus sabdariffa]|uniref:Uncharacterized protein n=1 Tax=Hibiscus sabdariffa TaxID=183260 RepID=A0ABR1ZH68_9ROSI